VGRTKRNGATVGRASTFSTGGSTVAPAITAVGVAPLSIVAWKVGEPGEQEVKITIKKKNILALSIAERS
jgi:hypothetical protein